MPVRSVLARDPQTHNDEPLATELLNALGSAVIATDVQGQIVFWNEAAERLYGWKATEVVGRNIVDVTPSSHSREQAIEIMGLLSQGESWSGRFETRHKNGEVMLVDVTDTPVRDDVGNLKAVVGVSNRAIAISHGHASEQQTQQSRLESAIRAAVGWLLSQRSASWRDYVIAALLFACAFLIRAPVEYFLGPSLPFLTYFPAVAIGAAICGLWPAALLLLASAVAGSFTFNAMPDGSVLSHIAAATLFLIAGIILVSIIEFSFYTQRQLKTKEEQLALVNRELGHRLKNIFAVTDAICRQTVMSKMTPAEMALSISGRIGAISAAQSLIAGRNHDESDFEQLIETIVAPMAPDRSRFGLSGTPVSIPQELTTSFALVLHELSTNALKYGAWAGPTGRVNIHWTLTSAGELEVEWREFGFSNGSLGKSGFGSILIKRALQNAQVDYDVQRDKVLCIIRMPLGTSR